ncbi:DUF5305 family protein [Halorubellus litoreus]|uniref:DUF5305 family protein n=1 Tax=Halorubellus litoreus TaxID=755308 RepID=A0ABD5VKD6_9EURY
MSDSTLRLRAFLDANLMLVLGVLVVVIAIGGWVTATTHIAPGTETVERTASEWETTGTFEHRAIVTEENALYPIGANLTNRSTYLARVAPRFEGRFVSSYRASDSGTVNRTVQLELVMQGVRQDRMEDNLTVLWSKNRTLGRDGKSSLQPGEHVSVPFSFNATAVSMRAEDIEEAIGKPSRETRIVLVATVRTVGRVNGEPVESSHKQHLSLDFRREAYDVTGSGPETQSFEDTRTVTREQEYGALRAGGGPLLLFLGMVGFGLVVTADHHDRIRLSAVEEDRITYLEDRKEFDEWISEIHLPEQAFELPRAEAASLGSLVDFAIDTDNGVVESPHEAVFYVVHDGYLYEYRPPALDHVGSVEPAVGGDDSEPVYIDEPRVDETQLAGDEVGSGVVSGGAED